MTDRSNEGVVPEAQRSRRTTWLIVVAVLVVAVGVVAGPRDSEPHVEVLSCGDLLRRFSSGSTPSGIHP